MIALLIFRASAGSEDGRPRSLADNGQLVFVARFVDGSEGVFLFDGVESPSVPFKRGSCNNDDNFDIADPVFLLSYLYIGGETPTCIEACDVNGDGLLDCADAVYQLRHFFLGTPPPPAPYPDCGLAAEDADCLSSSCSAP